MKRRRFKQTTSLQTRLNEEASRLRRQARRAPAERDRTMLFSKARQMKEAAQMTDFLAPQVAAGHEAG